MNMRGKLMNNLIGPNYNDLINSQNQHMDNSYDLKCIFFIITQV
jgi:hypothetical protein